MIQASKRREFGRWLDLPDAEWSLIVPLLPNKPQSVRGKMIDGS